MPFNLFALTNNPEQRVLRFSLSHDVQNELTTYLKQQEEAFNIYAQHEFIFDGKYKPDDGECLVINNYDDIDNLNEAIENPLAIAEIDPEPEVFSTIKALFTGYTDATGQKIILIQHFDKRKIISTRGLSIFHSANVYKKIEGIGITIDTKLSAVITGSTLKFFSFHVIRQIFDLSQYYLEATDSDIRDFSEIPSVKARDIDNLVGISDAWIRRKFALIQQSRILETVPINMIKSVALDFNINLPTVVENGVEVIELPDSRAELKTILRFLDEDYYKSSLSSTNYITNSKRPA